MKFLKCNLCGQEVIVTNDTNLPISCCGEEMSEIIPNSSDGATEKHVPVCNINNNVVNIKIGQSPHPMAKEHYIDWIILETNLGHRKVILEPGDNPEYNFNIMEGETIKNVYIHCNIHGLWTNK